MLSSFIIRNFRSILELKLDFTYGEGKAPNRHQEQEIMPFLEGGKKQRLVPCMAFFGANASGKTNILRSFAILKGLIRGDAPLADLFDPNRLNRKFADTTFELTFLNGEDTFNYKVTYDSSSIKEEALLKNGSTCFRIRELKAEFSPALLSAAYSEEKLADIIRVECSDGNGRQTKSFLHRIGQAYPGLNADLKTAATYIGNLNYQDNQHGIPLPIAVSILASTLKGDRSAALSEITDVVRRLDIDIQGIDMAQREVDEAEILQPGAFLQINPMTGARHTFLTTSTHKDVDGKTAVFDFIKQESAGTQRLAGLMGLVLYTLRTGGLLVIDEMECSLHPLLMREIVLMFKKRSLNPRGAQLVFNTHNTDILDDSILRLSEISLVRKTLANGTIVRRLIDIRKDGEDIRNITNFRKQYLDGLYSGIPHPAL